jgi:hypothetical protein
VQSTLYVEAAQTQATDQQHLIIDLSIAFTLVVSVTILLFFLPRIGVINDELRQRKGLLLLLPPQLMGRLPVVRRLIQDVLDESSLDSNAGGRQRRHSHGSSAGTLKA